MGKQEKQPAMVGEESHLGSTSEGPKKLRRTDIPQALDSLKIRCRQDGRKGNRDADDLKINRGSLGGNGPIHIEENPS